MMDPTKMRGCMVGLHILTEHKDANIGPISSLWQKMEQGKKRKNERKEVNFIFGWADCFNFLGF